MPTIDLEKVQIPPLPEVTHRVMRFDPMSETASSYALEQIVQPDEGVCADLLRIANSAYYGRSGRVKSLRDAITLLGLKTVKNVAIMLATRTMNSALKHKTFLAYISNFSIIAALVAEELADKLGHRDQREQAFLGGLLHKIGMTIIAMNQGADYAQLIQDADENFDNLITKERSLFGTDHVEVGQVVFDKWNIPEDLQTVIRDHNFPADETESMSDLVRITALASLCAREMLGQLLPMEDLDRRARIAAHYDATEIIGHYDDARLIKLQEHPFFQLVNGA